MATASTIPTTSTTRLGLAFLFLTIVTIVLYPFGELSLFVAEFKLYVLSGSLLIALVFYTLWRKEGIGEGIKSHSYSMYLLPAYVGWASLSIIWSTNRSATMSGLLKLWFLFLFAYAVNRAFYQFPREHFAKAVFLGPLLALIVGSSVIYYKLVFVYGLDRLDELFASEQVASGNPAFSTYVFTVFIDFPLGNSQNIILSLFVSWLGLAIAVYYTFPLFKKAYSFLLFSLFYSLPVFYLGISKSAFVGLALLLGLFVLVGILFKNKSLLKIVALLLLAHLLFVLINPWHVREAALARFGFSAVSYELAKERIDDQPVKEDGKQDFEKQAQGREKDFQVNGQEDGQDNKAREQTIDKPSPEKPAERPTDNSVTARLSLLKVAWAKFKERPIFGNGYRGLEQEYLSLGKDKNTNPHNIYLQILAELGLIGFIIFVSFFLFLAAEIVIRKNQQFYLYLAVIASYLARGLVELQFSELDIWLILLVLVVVLEQEGGAQWRQG